MAYSKSQIIADIESHISSRGGSYSDWYVGISNDPRARLFTDHNVNEKTGKWIYREAHSADDAREVEDFFVNQRSTDGGPGGGDETSKYVYAYKKTADTNP